MRKMVNSVVVRPLSVCILIACLLLLVSCGKTADVKDSEGEIESSSPASSEEQEGSESSGAPALSSSNPESEGIENSLDSNDGVEVSSGSVAGVHMEVTLPVENGDEACEYVRERLEFAGKNVPPIIECEGMSTGRYKVHGYVEVHDPEGGHTATQFWYDVSADGAIYDASSLIVIDPETMEPYDPYDTAPLSAFDVPSDGQYICNLGNASLNAWVSDGYLIVVGQASCWPFDGKDREDAEAMSMHHAFLLDGADIFSDAEPDVEGVEELARFLPMKYPCFMEVIVENGAVTFVRIYE